MKKGDPIVETLYAAVEALEAQEVPYALIGGLAVQVHARPRWSQDVDLLLDARESQRAEIVRLMGDKGFEPVPGPPARLAGVVLVQLQRTAHSVPIDIRMDLLFGVGEFHRQMLTRAQPVPLGTRNVRVVAAEDLVLLKLLASRPVDLVDAVDVIRENKADLDGDYLTRWAERLDVAERLAQATRDADAPPT